MITDPKTMARRLRADLAGRGLDVSHSTALEIVAHIHGFADWNTMSANSTSAGASESPTPGTGTQVIGRISGFRAAQEAAWIEALGFTHEAQRPSDHPGFRRLRSGHAVVEVEAREHQMPSADLVIAVDDLDEAHARVAALPHDIAHAGSVAAVDTTPNALRQFTISTPSGHPIAEIRERFSRAPSSPRRPGAASDNLAPITARVEFPASAYSGTGLGGPSIWVKAECFRTLTGVTPRSFDYADGAQGAFRLSRGVARAVAVGGETRVPFLELIWQGDGSRDMECLVYHRDGSPASHLRIESIATRRGTDVVTVEHGGWNEANRAARQDYLDWPERSAAYAAACRAAPAPD